MFLIITLLVVNPLRSSVEDSIRTILDSIFHAKSDKRSHYQNTTGMGGQIGIESEETLDVSVMSEFNIMKNERQDPLNFIAAGEKKDYKSLRTNLRAQYR